MRYNANKEALRNDWCLKRVNHVWNIKAIHSYQLKSTMGISVQGEFVRQALRFPNHKQLWLDKAKHMASLTLKEMRGMI